MDRAKVSIHSFTQLFEPVAAESAESGTVKCVFLNACESETVGEGLRESDEVCCVLEDSGARSIKRAVCPSVLRSPGSRT